MTASTPREGEVPDPAGELLCQIVASIPDSVQSFEFDRDARNGYFARLRLSQPSRATSRKRGVA